MIGRLALAQLRAYRAQSVWTLVLLSLVAAMMTASAVMGSTQNALLDTGYWQVLGSRDSAGYADMTLGTPAGDRRSVTVDELEAAVTGAPGSNAVAVSQTTLFGPGYDPSGEGHWESAVWAIAVFGDDQGVPVVEGRAPQARGEIALAANIADDFGLAIGDTAPFYAYKGGAGYPDTLYDFTLVGITPSQLLPGYQTNATPAYISWDEATQPDGAIATNHMDADGATWFATSVDLAWDGDPESLRPFYSGAWADDEWGYLPDASVVWWGSGVVLLVALVVMSFAVGRTQASRRSQWVATMRTMGARRRDIAGAALLETGMLGGGALVFGVGGGVALTQVQLTIARAMVEHPVSPWHVSIDWFGVALPAAALVVAALVISAVPAFWASRVAPTAALKPVSELTEAEISRRVSVVWAVVPLIAGVAMAWVARTGASFEQSSDVRFGVIVVATLAAVVGGFTTVLEGLRMLVPLAGRRLARSVDVAKMVAGEALTSRPRQAVAPAIIIALGLAGAGLGATFVAHVPDGIAWNSNAWLTGDETYGELVRMVLLTGTAWGLMIVASLALQVVTGAIAVSHATATADESATLGALGLDARSRQRAAWWQAWTPHLLGVGVGIVVTGIGIAFMALTGVDYQGYGSEHTAAASWIGLAATAVIALMLLTFGAASAWAVTRFTVWPPPAPAGVTGPAALTGASS